MKIIITHKWQFKSLLLFLFILPIFFYNYNVLAFSGSGDGNIGSPFIIDSCIKLQEIQSNLDAHYILTDDINCHESSSWNNGAGFTPINSFRGSLDGHNFTISGIKIYLPFSENPVGVFGDINSSTIKNIHFSMGEVYGGISNSGSVIGHSENSYIENVHTNISVKTNEITEAVGVGGLIGNMNSTVMSKSSSKSTVESNTQNAKIGGLVGIATNSDIRNVYYSGTITASGSYIGGVGGYITNTLYTSYASGTINVTKESITGGILGYGNVDASFSNTILNSLWQKGGVGGLINGAWNYYNQYVSGANDCIAETYSPYCFAVNTDNSEPDYFINNSGSPPLDAWDFSNIWYIHIGSLPNLIGKPLSVDISTVNTTNSSITINWNSINDGGSPITSYQIQYSSDSGNPIRINDIPPTDNPSYAIYGLPASSNINVQVRAINQYGASPWQATSAYTQNNLDPIIPVVANPNINNTSSSPTSASSKDDDTVVVLADVSVPSQEKQTDHKATSIDIVTNSPKKSKFNSYIPIIVALLIGAILVFVILRKITIKKLP